MKRLLAILLALPIIAATTIARADPGDPVPVCGESEEHSWMFHPSYFSHEPQSGTRVAQYIPEQATYLRDDPTYQESGYRHDQIFTYGPDGSADRMHVVQTWGAQPVRPYGEWAFPYRAGATPYGPWGNPQGPWTMPFDSWQNPYGLLNHINTPYWSSPGGPGPIGPSAGSPGYGPAYGPGYGSGPSYGPAYGPSPGYGPGYGGGGSTPYSPTPPMPGYP